MVNEALLAIFTGVKSDSAPKSEPLVRDAISLPRELWFGLSRLQRMSYVRLAVFLIGSVHDGMFRFTTKEVSRSLGLSIRSVQLGIEAMIGVGFELVPDESDRYGTWVLRV